MLVSAISQNPYSSYTSFQPWYVNVRGSETEIASDIYAPTDPKTEECSSCKLYYNINQWKHFCHKQIEAGNLDVIA